MSLQSKKQAVRWYYEVNDLCQSFSEIYNISLMQVSGIMSALSPNNTFANNCKSLHKFLEHEGNCKVSTFNGQKEKARKILRMDEPSEKKIKAILGGLKTQAFFENIYRPETSESVTVDLWMIRWAKKLKLIPNEGTLTTKRYGIVSQAIKEKADNLGLKPHEYQALSWTKIRTKQY